MNGKKLTALLLAASMILVLCACGKSKAAKEAEERIAAIGEVTLESKETVEQAKAFYEGLREEEKAEVENYAVLEEAIALYEEIEAAYLEDLALTELTEDPWINVNDGDSYSLQRDGTGTHDGAAVTFTKEENRLSIVEGAASVQGRVFLWDRERDIPRLIPEGENVFYVRERDYSDICQQIREENTGILLAHASWKRADRKVTLSFAEDGTGTVKIDGMLSTAAADWELLDNNTVKFTFSLEEKQDNGFVKRTTFTFSLDIINEHGEHRLINVGNGDVYKPAD